MRAGRYWMRLSRFLTITANCRGVLDWVQVRRVGGHLDEGQPVGMRLDEG
jgi:hypothetical protein